MRKAEGSLRGSHGMAGGSDGCLEVTSELRHETNWEKQAVGR